MFGEAGHRKDTANMLPGFRILFASVVLSVSILIFGLGAAALLRAAHEEFVKLPSWREAQKPVPQLPNPQLPVTAQIAETKPVLALLRIEPTVTTPSEIKLPDPATAPGITTATATDGVAGTKVEEAQPSKPRLRRTKRSRFATSIRRQRAISRIRAARATQAGQFQQQQQNADPFRLFPSPGNNGS